MRKILLKSIAPVALVSACALAQEPAVEPNPIQLFQAPVMTAPVHPDYPIGALRASKEGWVRVNFMVDTQGQPYEIRVVDRAGGEEFVAATRRALESTTFQPARVGDQPVHGSLTRTYRFMINEANGARRGFSSRYRRLMTALETNRKQRQPSSWRCWRRATYTTTMSTRTLAWLDTTMPPATALPWNR